MIPWDLSKCETYCSLWSRLGTVAGCWVTSVIACSPPTQAMRDEGPNALHSTVMAERKWLIMESCWNILHFEFKTSLVFCWVFRMLWLHGEDKFTFPVVLSFAASSSTFSVQPWRRQRSSAFSLARCLVVHAVVLSFALFSFLFSIFTLLWAVLK